MFKKKVLTHGPIGSDFVAVQNWQQNQTIPFLKQAISHQIFCGKQYLSYLSLCLPHNFLNTYLKSYVVFKIRFEIGLLRKLRGRHNDKYVKYCLLNIFNEKLPVLKTALSDFAANFEQV